MPRLDSVLRLILTGVTCLLGLVPVFSQGVAGTVAFEFDPSIRSAGMGRSGVATFWGEDLDAWRNPALLGYCHGFSLSHGRTQLVPDLADDVYFTSDRLMLGAWGVGVCVVGKPIGGLGKILLDYGESEITPPGMPGPSATYHPWERIRSFGVGVNAVETIENATRLFGGMPAGIHDWIDLSVGTTSKTDSLNLEPGLSDTGEPGVPVSATNHDRGYLLRLTPYNSLDGRAGWSALDSALRPIIGGWRLDVAYGESRLSHDESTSGDTDNGQAEPPTRYSIRGLATRLAVGLPAGLDHRLEESGKGWLAAMITPLVSLGKAWDREQASVRNQETGVLERFPRTRQVGWELTLANIYTIRRGHVDEPERQILGDTDGWGVGLRLADLASLQYDHATIPQPNGSTRVTRKSWRILVDPVAIWQVTHSRPIRCTNRHY